MGATLAGGGVNPATGERAWSRPAPAAVMATAGLYEHSGQWLFDVGLPGKSGVGRGNSVRGLLATRFLSERLGLNLFASTAVERNGASGARS